jgi:hypothetical protein
VEGLKGPIVAIMVNFVPIKLRHRRIGGKCVAGFDGGESLPAESAPARTSLMAEQTNGVRGRQHADKGWSFTDCVSFGVMRELRIRDAFTTDHHFSHTFLC